MPAAKGKSLEDFRAVHDKSFMVPKAIRTGLEALGDSWEYESDLIKRCKLSQTDFAAYRDQFKDFFVEVPGRNAKRAWAGTKKFAAQLKDRLQ